MVGHTREAEGILAQMQAIGEGVPPIAPAVLHLALGQIDEARDAFTRCIAERDWHVLLLYSDPIMKTLVDGTGLHKLLDGLGLPEPE